MGKIIRLTESDLTKLVKRVINEQKMENIADKILDDPKVERAAEEAVSQMSSKDIRNIKMIFANLGVSPNSSLSDVRNAVEDVVDDDMGSSREMNEDEEMSPKKKLWTYVRRGLIMLGIANASLFFVPFSALVDKMMDLDPENWKSMEVSFIISNLLVAVGLFAARVEKKTPKI